MKITITNDDGEVLSELEVAADITPLELEQHVEAGLAEARLCQCDECEKFVHERDIKEQPGANLVCKSCSPDE